MFPVGSITFDCGLIMRDIPHEWESAKEMYIGSRDDHMIGLQRSMEAKMRFHVKGFLVATAFAVLFLVAVDVRLGLAAVIAAAVIDWLSLALPLGPGRVRNPRHD